MTNTQIDHVIVEAANVMTSETIGCVESDVVISAIKN